MGKVVDDSISAAHTVEAQGTRSAELSREEDANQTAGLLEYLATPIYVLLAVLHVWHDDRSRQSSSLPPLGSLMMAASTSRGDAVSSGRRSPQRQLY